MLDCYSYDTFLAKVAKEARRKGSKGLSILCDALPLRLSAGRKGLCVKLFLTQVLPRV